MNNVISKHRKSQNIYISPLETFISPTSDQIQVQKQSLKYNRCVKYSRCDKQGLVVQSQIEFIMPHTCVSVFITSGSSITQNSKQELIKDFNIRVSRLTNKRYRDYIERIMKDPFIFNFSFSRHDDQDIQNNDQ